MGALYIDEGTQPRPQVTCTENLVKFGRMVYDIYEWTDRQTNRHADCNTSHPYRVNRWVLTWHLNAVGSIKSKVWCRPTLLCYIRSFILYWLQDQLSLSQSPWTAQLLHQWPRRQLIQSASLSTRRRSAEGPQRRRSSRLDSPPHQHQSTSRSWAARRYR